MLLNVVLVLLNKADRDSSVGIATRYGLEGRGIESQWGGGGEIFRICPHRHWGPPSLLYNRVAAYFQGVKQPWRGVKTHRHLEP